MAKKLEIYKCEVCGNIAEVLHAGDGDLVCCEQPMQKLEAKTQDEGKEKHVPVISKTEKGITVKVGSTEHPMEENHYIEWIEVIDGNAVCKMFLKPGDKPEVQFMALQETVSAREYCNKHGLWKAE